MNEFPSNDEIKIGMKVLVELIKDRGNGKLTEGIVIEKIGFMNKDRHGCLVIVKIKKNEKYQGRVHKILDADFVNKKDIIKHIELLPDQYYTSRKKVMELLSQSEDFIWLFLGYFRHNHFDILKEVLENNKSIKEIKIITTIQRKNQKNLFELLLENSKMFKKEYSLDIQIKILNDKDAGAKLHNRYYFTKDRQYDFIDFDQMKNSQRSEIQLLDQTKFKENSERDFLQYWNLETTFDLFNKNDVKKILEYFD
jgi:primosomal protein N'